MNRWRSVVCLLIALWLPLQGYGAVVMPFCQHAMTRSSVQPGNEIVQSHQHHGDHAAHLTRTESPDSVASVSFATHAGNDSAANLGCDNCGACHLACAPAISAGGPVFLLAVNTALVSANADVLLSFYPEQLQRPPLSALA